MADELVRDMFCDLILSNGLSERGFSTSQKRECLMCACAGSMTMFFA